MEKLLSIIIPIYNVRKYLESCLKSFNATAEENRVEILLVDDGSTDDSATLVDELVKSMPNTRVFHKKNGGLSDARNYGTEIASGKYIMYVDSDDEVNASALARVIEELSSNDCDALVWNAVRIDEHGQMIPLPDNAYYGHGGLIGGTVYNFKDFITIQIEDHRDFASTAWMAAFKRSIIEENCLRFEKGLLHEDELWTPRILGRCENIFYIDVDLYLYRERKNSITSDASKEAKRLKDLIYIYRQQYVYFSGGTKYTRLDKTLCGIISKRFLHHLGTFEYELIKNNISYADRWQIFFNSVAALDRIRAFVLLISLRLYLFASGKKPKK